MDDLEKKASQRAMETIENIRVYLKECKSGVTSLRGFARTSEINFVSSFLRLYWDKECTRFLATIPYSNIAYVEYRNSDGNFLQYI